MGRSSFMSDPIFPQEIFGLIIASIDTRGAHESFDPTLRACSLVCTSFRDPAQRRLFTSITLTLPDPPDEHIAPVSVLWRSSPRLCGYIENLGIMISAPEECEPLPIAPLPRLRAITLFPFRYLLAPDAFLKWQEVPPEVRRALYEVMWGPGVESLRLEWVEGFPVNAIVACGALRELELIDTEFAEKGDDVISETPRSEGEPQGCIEFMEVFNTVVEPLFLFSSPKTLISLASLISLEYLVNERNSCEECQTILDLTAPFLTELLLVVAESYIKDLTLPHPKILRHIKFLPENLTDFRTIAPFLESLPSDTPLEKFCINDYKTPAGQRRYDLERIAEWHRIESTLMRAEWLPCLVQIGVPHALDEASATFGFAVLMPNISSTRRMEMTNLKMPNHDQYSIVEFMPLPAPPVIESEESPLPLLQEPRTPVE
ncbi:hypothetical protein DXG01_007075 [Tephrocybe rancida]|nr:hypothetical protein DXG01_007075 [Tephrocybe rancida]